MLEKGTLKEVDGDGVDEAIKTKAKQKTEIWQHTDWLKMLASEAEKIEKQDIRVPTNINNSRKRELSMLGGSEAKRLKLSQVPITSSVSVKSVSNGDAMIDAVSKLNKLKVERELKKKRKKAKERPRCIHGRARSGYYCKQCPGAGICSHGRNKHRCHMCGTDKKKKNRVKTGTVIRRGSSYVPGKNLEPIVIIELLRTCRMYSVMNPAECVNLSQKIKEGYKQIS
eukprot:g1131.t1